MKSGMLITGVLGGACLVLWILMRLFQMALLASIFKMGFIIAIIIFVVFLAIYIIGEQLS